MAAAAPLALIGTGINAVGTIAGGMAKKRAAEFEAAQLEVRAEEERAASQREAQEIRQQKQGVLSRQTAVNATSGFAASDETSQRLAGEVEQQGTYRELMAKYTGDERARGLRAQAQGARASGRAAMTGALFGAAGSFLGGVSNTMFNMYGGGGPFGGSPMDIRPFPQRGYP